MNNRFEALERLAKLRDLNVLTEEEFAAEKSRILSSEAAMTETSGATDEVSRKWTKQRWFPWMMGAWVMALGGFALGYALLGDLRPREADTKGAVGPERGKGADAAIADLDSLLVFQDPATCAPAEKLQSFLDDLRARSAGDLAIDLPGIQAGARAVIQESDEKDGSAGVVLVSVPITGIWNGLKVSAIRTATWSEGGAKSFQIRFGDGVEKVRRVLTAEGFNVGADGELKDAADGHNTRGFGIESIEGGAALTCGMA